MEIVGIQDRMAKLDSQNSQESSGVLKTYAGHGVATFSAHYEPQILFAKKLPNVAEAVLKKSKAPHWQATADKYTIRETNKKYIYHSDFQVFYCQTLGLDPWMNNLDDHIEIIATALNKMDVTRIRRLGFQVSIQVPMDMSHSELCDLMFGSYLVEREELLTIYGKVDDLLIQLHGTHKNIKTQTIIAPQTKEQSRKAFLSTGNLEFFVEPKYIDTCVKDHLDRVSMDCLALVIDMVREDIPVSAIQSTVKDSLEGAGRIANGTMLKLKGLKPRGQVSHGDGSNA